MECCRPVPVGRPPIPDLGRPAGARPSPGRTNGGWPIHRRCGEVRPPTRPSSCSCLRRISRPPRAVPRDGESRVERPVRVKGEVGVHNSLSSGIEVDDMHPSLAVGADWSCTVELHGSVPPSTDLPQESSFSIPDLHCAVLAYPVVAGIIDRHVPRPVDVPRPCRVTQSHNATNGYAALARGRTLQDVHGGGAVLQRGQIRARVGDTTTGERTGQGNN